MCRASIRPIRGDGAELASNGVAEPPIETHGTPFTLQLRTMIPGGCVGAAVRVQPYLSRRGGLPEGVDPGNRLPCPR